MELKESIVEGLKNSNTLDIKYTGRSDEFNHGFVKIQVGNWSEEYPEGNYNKFLTELYATISLLTLEHPNIGTRHRKVEIHILYHGFNSVSSQMLPYCVTIDTTKREKTGMRNDAESIECRKMGVLEYLNAHPDYEFYFRHGFSFRGAQERKIDRNGTFSLCKNLRMYHNLSFEEWLKGALSDCATYDVDVIDDEVHVNTYSCNDMW